MAESKGAERPGVEIGERRAAVESRPKDSERAAAFVKQINTGLERGKRHHEILKIISGEDGDGKSGKVLARAKEAPRRRGRREAAFDFDDYLTKNPPIEGVFDPNAREKRAGHEAKQARQDEAMMRCRTLIEAHIESDAISVDSSASRGQLKDLVDKFAGHYGFTDKQRGMTKDLVDAYYDHRQEAVELRRKYSNDRELAEKVTKVKIPESAGVEVSVGPWGLIITTNNEVTNKVLYRGQTPPTDFVAGGLADIYARPPFIILNAGLSDKQTLSHEEQHVRYEMNRKVFQRHNQDIFGYSKDTERSYPPTQEQIENQLRNDRRHALDRAKDEIFAYTFNSDHFPLELFTTQDNNPYDYLYAQREHGAAHGDFRYRETSHKIFVTEYNRILALGAGSFEALMKSGGYSNKEAIAMLSGQPMDQWAATVQRVMESKGVAAPEREVAKYVRYVESEEAKARPRPITDAVITGEDRFADWYKERMKVKAKKKDDEEKSGSSDSQMIDQYTSLTTINRLLYEATRFGSGLPTDVLDGQALSQYFTFVDKETISVSNLLHGKPFNEAVIEEAKARILMQVDALVHRQN
jgi:hypothetical protein